MEQVGMGGEEIIMTQKQRIALLSMSEKMKSFANW
jgi:hypothetical protein